MIIDGSQHDRDPGEPAPVLDVDEEMFTTLHLRSVGELRELGLQPWDEPDDDGYVLMLFPAEWYDNIPDGFIVTDINRKPKVFRGGYTDDDRRMGVLPYGIEVKA